MNPELLETKVNVTGSLEKYFGAHAGVKNPSGITLASDEGSEVLASDLIISEYIEGKALTKPLNSTMGRAMQ